MSLPPWLAAVLAISWIGGILLAWKSRKIPGQTKLADSTPSTEGTQKQGRIDPA